MTPPRRSPNTGRDAAISRWTVTWTFANGQTITQLWNGTVSTSGSAVTVTNVSYNGTVPAGGTNAVPALTCTA